MSALSSDFSWRFEQLDFTIDGDFERNCDEILSILPEYSREPLATLGSVRLAIRLFNYSSWLLYRYGRLCCARELCYHAIELLLVLIQSTRSPYLYLLLLDEIVNVGRLDRSVKAWAAAAERFQEVAMTVSGGWVWPPKKSEPVKLSVDVRNHLDSNVPNWADDWYTQGVRETITTLVRVGRFRHLLEVLEHFERTPLPSSRAAVYRGRVEAYIGLREFSEALQWYIRAVDADFGDVELPYDYIRLMQIYSGLSMDSQLIEVTRVLDEQLLFTETPRTMSTCATFLTVAQAYYELGIYERGDAHLAECVQRSQTLGCQRVMAQAQTLALRRAIEMKNSEQISILCQELHGLMSNIGYLQFRPEAFGALSRAFHYLGCYADSEVYRSAAEVWSRKVSRITCDTDECLSNASVAALPPALQTQKDLDKKVTHIYDQITLATREKRKTLAS